MLFHICKAGLTTLASPMFSKVTIESVVVFVFATGVSGENHGLRCRIYLNVASGSKQLLLVGGPTPRSVLGITSKGPWSSSKTPGIQQALSNEYLKKAGLYSLRDGWIAVHYPNQKV
jgi:hypothetical protein